MALSKKELEIIIKARDQATSTLKKTTLSMKIWADKARRNMESVAKIARKVRTAFGLIAKATLGLAASAGGAIFALSRVAGSLDRIAKTSLQTGVSVKSLSELRVAAERSGGSFENLASSYAEIQKRITEFQLFGVGEAERGLKALGLRMEDVTNSAGELIDSTELLPLLAERLQEVDSSTRIFAIDKLAGGQGVDSLLKLLNQGPDALRQYADEARKLNVVFSDKQVQIAERFVDSIGRIKDAFLGLGAQALEKIGPWLTRVNNQIASFVASVPTLVRNLIKTFKDAFGGGQNGDEARSSILELFASLFGYVQTVATEYMSTAFIFLAEGLIAIVRLLKSIVIDQIVAALPEIADTVISASGDVIENIASLLGADIDLDVWLLPLRTASAHILSVSSTAKKTAPELRKEFFDIIYDEAGVVRVQLEKMWEALSGPNLDRVIAAADSVSGVLDEVSRRSVGVIDKSFGFSNTSVDNSDDDEAAKKAAGFGQGFRDAIKQAAEGAEGLGRVGTQAANTLTNNLGSAITGTITRVNSMKDAFRNFAESTVQSLAQVATQMLVVKALGGIFSAATGGVGGGGGGSFVAPASSLLLGSGASRAAFGPGLNRGGMILKTAAGAMAIATAQPMAFASGGVVPGQRTHRDSVLAALTPGEAVITEDRVRQVGLNALEHGSIGSGSSSGDVNITINVTVSGSGTEPRAAGRDTGRIAARVLIDELSRSPALRERMRGAIGGRA